MVLIAVIGTASYFSFRRDVRYPYKEPLHTKDGVSFSPVLLTPAGFELTRHIVDDTRRTWLYDRFGQSNADNRMEGRGMWGILPTGRP